MGLKTRAGSSYWWAELEGTKGPGKPYNIRVSTKIRHTGATEEQTEQLRRDALYFYQEQMRELTHIKNGWPSIFPAPAEAEKPARLFRDQSAWYLKTVTSKHKGLGPEGSVIRTLDKAFGHLALDQITKTLWQEFEAQRRTVDKVKHGTIARNLAVMRRILASAIPEYLADQPLAEVERPTKAQLKVKAKRTLGADEELAIATALGRIDPEIRDMYLVGLGTLLRRSNIVHLRRSELLVDRLAVETKTGPHEVPIFGPTPLQERAYRVLVARMPADADGFFFPKWHAIFKEEESGQNEGASTMFLRRVKIAVASIGLRWGLRNGGVVWHTMTRASGATRMHRDFGKDLRTVQQIGGWASLDQMMAYLGIDQENLFQAVHFAPSEQLAIPADAEPLGTNCVHSDSETVEMTENVSKIA